jgi:predicted DNA-binding protein (UPF0251 family)
MPTGKIRDMAHRNPLSPPSSAESSVPQRVTLPSDLSTSLRYVDDAELERLRMAVTVEINRRDQGASTRHADERLALPRPPIRKASSTVEELPEGKANLIRASFNAGLKPATIARTFHISQSLVHRVIKSADKPGR